MLKQADRLIVGELWQPFLFGLLSFALLIISATMLKSSLDFMIKFNLPFSLFLKMVALGVPQVIVFSFPMSVLLGVLLAIGRLNNDSEIIALRAAGVSLWRVAAPAFLFAIVVAGMTFLLNERIVPSANAAVLRIKNEVLLRKTGAVNQQNLVLPFYHSGKLSFLLLAEKLQGDRLSSVRFFLFGKEQSQDSWIIAESGVWQEDHWVFENGRRFQVLKDGTVLTSFFQTLDIRELAVAPTELTRKSKSSLEMNIAEMRAYISDLRSEGLWSEARKNLVEYYFKYTTPLASIFFVFIAFPLAISPARTTGGQGLGIAILIVLFYYVLMVLVMKLGQAGAIPAEAASWIPNAAVAGVGYYLFKLKNG